MYGRSNLEELSVSSLEKPKNLHQKRYSAYKVYFPKEKMERRLSLDSQMSIDLARTTQSFKRPKVNIFMLFLLVLHHIFSKFKININFHFWHIRKI